MLKYILPLILPWMNLAKSPDEYCERITYRDARYIICKFHPLRDDIRLFYTDPNNGQVFRNFTHLKEFVERDGHDLLFAMNAGMYHPDMRPVGLYRERGAELSSLVTAGGWGNFHLLPNGVFYLNDRKAGVIESFAYEKAGIEPQFATQSGPMLVIDGELHPKFLADSDSLKIRNGVGVDESGFVHFAISEDRVRFYDFGLLFKDHLKTPNALYFDGTISSVDIPSLGRRDRLFPMGPMVGVVRKRDSDTTLSSEKN